MDKFVGKRLDGRYEIRDIIGIGGMAVVYKAYDNIEDRIVAIKILKEEFSNNDEFLRRFKNESKAIAVLSHPNIVKVYDVSFGEIFQYIVMEYIDGITLKTYIENQGSLPWKDALNFTNQILRALQHAHDKGIVHRDIKPQNIMVLSDGTIKVTDFGIARFARNEHKTITDKAIGSVHYISPEQAKGEQTDERTDMYSVGVMLYEMLTGKLPFEADSAVSVAIMQLQTEAELPSKINPTIPLGVEQITMRAMRKDASLRYSSAAEMLRDLERIKKDPDLTFETPVFIDDSPTKFVGETDDNDKNIKNSKDEKSSMVPVLTGVAISFGVIILIVLGIVIANLFKKPNASFECPNFVGMQYEDIDRYDDRYTIKFIEEYSETVPVGEVIRQTPVAGTKIKNNPEIEVVVSKGDMKVNLPNCINLDLNAAKAELISAGFKNIKTVERADDSTPANTVIDMQPAAHTSTSLSAEITLFISSGAVLENVDLPDVVNLSLEDATQIINRNGLVVGKIEYVDSDPSKKDIVLEQTPAPSASVTQAGKGTAVDLKVGLGYKANRISLKVDLPIDYVSQYASVSFWVDNGFTKKEESVELDLWTGASYTYNIVTQDDEIEVLVKIKAKDSSKYDNFVKFKIDCKSKTILETIPYSYPKKS